MVQALRRDLPAKSRQHGEWTFLDISTKKYTHALHLYPARMHPEIARKIIFKYAKDRSNVVLDPFMGSGGVLLEAILHGNNAIGIDVNPFAVLLTKVKTTPLKADLSKHLESILKRSARDSLDDKDRSINIPTSYDTENWFHRDTLMSLAVLKHNIYRISDANILDFFKICLSLTIRKSSYQRNGAWKTHRISNEDRLRFNPEPIDMFAHIVKDNIRRMDDLVTAKPSGTAYPILGDTRNMRLNFEKVQHVLNDSKVNLMITSPPYGDHKTTVAYGQFSRHSSHWLDLPDEYVLHVDKTGLGGRTYSDMDDLGSPTLNRTLDKIHKNDIKLTKNKLPCRDREAYSFFLDLDRCIDQISHSMIPKKSRACFVVANRTVRRVTVPTDVILAELGTKYGFTVEDVIYRDIPNKAMPSKNAPENITNETGKTMTRETILVMRC